MNIERNSLAFQAVPIKNLREGATYLINAEHYTPHLQNTTRTYLDVKKDYPKTGCLYTRFRNNASQKVHDHTFLPSELGGTIKCLDEIPKK
jgi:hypothetical protein